MRNCSRARKHGPYMSHTLDFSHSQNLKPHDDESEDSDDESEDSDDESEDSDDESEDSDDDSDIWAASGYMRILA